MVWRPQRRRQRVRYVDGNDNGNDDSNGNRISGANASSLARSNAKQTYTQDGVKGCCHGS